MMRGSANFYACLSDAQGRVVPGSERQGHNVVTRVGKRWLRALCGWTTPLVLPEVGVTPDDVALSSSRPRWIAVGDSSQLESLDVTALVSPLAYSVGPDTYLKVLAAATWPTTHSQRYTTTWGPTDFNSASVDIAEAGLFVDIDDGGGTLLDPEAADASPIAYKLIDPPLAKTNANTLTIIWELCF